MYILVNYHQLKGSKTLMNRRLCALSIYLICIALILTGASAYAVTPSDWSAENPEDLQEGHIFSQSAILIDYETGEVLFEKNADARMFPASTTKIMTLMLALESGIAMDTVVTIPEQAVDIPSDSSKIPVSAGEQLSFEDLLYGFMLNSGNDGAVAIAIIVSGSEDQFVAEMNARAQELGCTNTHFVNSHGYHDNDHYTSARDLAIITRAAMSIPKFREIVSTPTYVMSATNKHSRREITSRVEMILPDSKYYVAECTGIKTGFTSKAGQCFVGSAERGTRTVISVSLFSTRDYVERKWFDANCMFQYGFTQYDEYTIADMFSMGGDGINAIVVENAAEDDPQDGRLSLILSQTSNDGYSVMTLKGTDELDSYMEYFRANTTVTPSTDYLTKIEQRETIEAGSIVGTFSTYTQDGETVTGTLIAGRTVELEPFKVSMWDYVTDKLPFLKQFEESRAWYILVSVAVLLVLLIIVVSAHNARRNRRRKRIYEQRRRAYYERQRRQERRPSDQRRDPYDDF